MARLQKSLTSVLCSQGPSPFQARLGIALAWVRIDFFKRKMYWKEEEESLPSDLTRTVHEFNFKVTMIPRSCSESFQADYDGSSSKLCFDRNGFAMQNYQPGPNWILTLFKQTGAWPSSSMRKLPPSSRSCIQDASPFSNKQVRTCGVRIQNPAEWWSQYVHDRLRSPARGDWCRAALARRGHPHIKQHLGEVEGLHRRL